MVRLMRKLFTGLLTLSLLLILLGLILYNEQSVVQYLNETILHSHEKIVVHKNEYYRPSNFMFVQNTENHLVSSKQEIYNNFYSGINSGESEFSFYCKHDYKECLDDLTEIASNRDLLSHINNFTHPFNSFKQVETKFEPFGKVTIMLNKNYTKEEVNRLNVEVERLSKELEIYQPEKVRNNVEFIEKMKSEIEDELNRVDKGGVLNFAELLRVSENLKSARIIKSSFESVNDGSFPLLESVFLDVFAFIDLEKEIKFKFKNLNKNNCFFN